MRGGDIVSFPGYRVRFEWPQEVRSALPTGRYDMGAAPAVAAAAAPSNPVMGFLGSFTRLEITLIIASITSLVLAFSEFNF